MSYIFKYGEYIRTIFFYYFLSVHEYTPCRCSCKTWASVSSKYTHGKAKHGDTADEQLVLLGETDPAGRAEDTILDLRLGLGRSSLYNKGLTPSYTHTHEYMTEEQNKTRSMRAWTQHAHGTAAIVYVLLDSHGPRTFFDGAVLTLDLPNRARVFTETDLECL